MTQFTQVQIDLAKKRLHCPSELELLNEVSKIANAEQYITAEEARKLGAGKAEYCLDVNVWHVCWEGCEYLYQFKDKKFKYRAIKP